MIKKKQIVMMVSIAVASFLIGTMFSAFTNATDSGNPFEQIWEAIYGVEADVDSLNASLIELEERVRALEGPKPELVGYWSFDEGSGTTAHDSSGYGNNGTLIGGCLWVDGKQGKALWFGGGGSYVVVPHASDFSFAGAHPFTLVAWIKPDNPQGQSSLAANIIDKYSNYGLVHDHRNADARGVIFRSGGTWRHSGEVDISAGVWHHYVGVYDPPFLKAYLNGSEVASREVGLLSLDTNSNNIVFGTNMQLTSQYNGIIDEIRIYNGALSVRGRSPLYKCITLTGCMHIGLSILVVARKG